MKYKVRLYEENLKEATPLKAIKRHLEDPKMMQKVINNPKSVMATGVTDVNGKNILVSNPKDIILALNKYDLLPDIMRKEIVAISKDGIQGLKGGLKVEPTHDIQLAIDTYLDIRKEVNKFLTLFVPGAEGSVKSPEAIQGSIDTLAKSRSSSSSDVYKNA